MTTSAEDLNAAIASLQAAADAYNGKKAEIDARVNTLIPTVGGVLHRTVYVNADIGDDANPGTSAAPFKSLWPAAALTVSGGRLNINLQTDIVLDARIAFKGVQVSIVSDTLNVKRRIDWAAEIDGVVTNSPSLRITDHLATWVFRDIIFGNIVSSPHIVFKRMIECIGMQNIDTWICEWDTSAGDDLSFVSTNSQVALWILSGVVPVDQAGLWVDSVAAGTDPATVNRIVNTNLATL